MEAETAIVRSLTLAQWGTTSDARVIVAAVAKMAASDRSVYRRRPRSPSARASTHISTRFAPDSLFPCT